MRRASSFAASSSGRWPARSRVSDSASSSLEGAERSSSTNGTDATRWRRSNGLTAHGSADRIAPGGGRAVDLTGFLDRQDGARRELQERRPGRHRLRQIGGVCGFDEGDAAVTVSEAIEALEPTRPGLPLGEELERALLIGFRWIDERPRHVKQHLFAPE